MSFNLPSELVEHLTKQFAEAHEGFDFGNSKIEELTNNVKTAEKNELKNLKKETKTKKLKVAMEKKNGNKRKMEPEKKCEKKPQKKTKKNRGPY